MKKIIICAVALICAATINSQTPREKLDQLLATKDYFELRTLFRDVAATLSPYDRLYFQCYLDNAFNQNEDCIRHVDELLDNNGQVADSVAGRLLRLRSNSYVKCYRYAAAAATDSILFHRYQTAFDSSELADIENDFVFRKALAAVSPQTIRLTRDEVIPWQKNKLNLITVPVSSGDSTFDAVFDTRADFSCITESYVNKLGVRKLDVSFDEGSGLTDISFKASLGVADSLYVGGILFKHVVFLVMPDESLHFKQGSFDFQLNLIVGAPVIEQLGEFHLRRSGTILVPLEQHSSSLHNLATEFYSPVVRLKTGADWLHFYLDLGAATSQLFYEFYDRYREKIERTGKKSTIHMAGAGGIVKRDVYELPSLDLSTGNKTVVLKKVSVLTKPIQNSSRHFGNIGQDFVQQFQELIFNFRDMYFSAL